MREFKRPEDYKQPSAIFLMAVSTAFLAVGVIGTLALSVALVHYLFHLSLGH